MSREGIDPIRQLQAEIERSARVSKPDEQPTDIEVTSIFGASSRRGLVRIKLGVEEVLMPPSKARAIASFLLEASGAAESDEAMMTVLERMEHNTAKRAQMLMAIRSARGVIDQRTREEVRRAIVEDHIDPDHPH
jgi:hypothetical protein